MLLKSQKGSALILALLIGSLLAIFGMTLYTVGSTNARQVQQRSDQLQADYYANSGVNLALGIILKNGGNLLVNGGSPKTYYGTIDDGLSDTDPGNNAYTIKTIITYTTDSQGNPCYKISSYGYVGSSVQQASSNKYYQITRSQVLQAINDKNGKSHPIPNNIFAVGVKASTGRAIELTGSAYITGDVGTNSIGSGSVYCAYSTSIKNGDLYIGPDGNSSKVVTFVGGKANNLPNGSIKNLPATKSYPMPSFPTFPTLPQKTLTFKNWAATISESGYYQIFNVTGTLTINVGNSDISIVTDSMSVTGNIIVNCSGTGRLNLYVNDTLNMSKGSGKVNADGDFNNVVLYFKGSNLTFGGSTQFVGSLFAESASITIGGGGGITGHIITGGSSVAVNGGASANAKVIYAPNASVSITNGVQVKGAVVAHDITVSGSSYIAYDSSVNTDLFGRLVWDISDSRDTSAGKNIIQYGKWVKTNA